MRPFEHRDGRFVTEIEPIEAILVTQLAGQIRTILHDPLGATSHRIPDAPRDAALLRLLPDAYTDDAEAAAEFRRFTANGLASSKVRNADVVARDLADAAASDLPVELSLDAASVQAWLRSITDVRLVLATRLGIETDETDRAHDTDPSGYSDPSDATEETAVLEDVYDWLGWVQGSLVEALDSADQSADGGTAR